MVVVELSAVGAVAPSLHARAAALVAPSFWEALPAVPLAVLVLFQEDEVVEAAGFVPLSAEISAVLVPPSGAEQDLPFQPIAVLLSASLAPASIPLSFCSAGPVELCLVLAEPQ